MPHSNNLGVVERWSDGKKSVLQHANTLVYFSQYRYFHSVCHLIPIYFEDQLSQSILVRL